MLRFAQHDRLAVCDGGNARGSRLPHGLTFARKAGIFAEWTSVQPAPQPVEPVQQQPQAFRLAPNHWADVQDIRNEAVRLSREVGKGTITKVQAAQELNQFRLALVGSNVIDDNVYDVYLRGAVGSQSGQISSAQSKQLIQTALEVWQNSWPSMQNKPDNPAFTNFLMQTMGMTPLQ